MTHEFQLTKLQADEIAHRLAVNEQSQSEPFPEDRLPVWGSVTGHRLVVWSIADCLDDLDSMIEVHDDNSDDPWDGAKARGAARSVRGLREKVRAAVGRTNSTPDYEFVVATIRGGAR